MIQWKEFGDRNQYRVSACGLIQTRTNGTSLKLREEWREKAIFWRKCDYTGGGYLISSIKENGKFKTEYVHRIVAKNFIENPSRKSQVNHIDGDRTNNSVNNLEWNTPLENSKNSVDRGSHKEKGAFKGKLTLEKVLTIVTLINAGKTNKEIAIAYNIDRSNISKLRHKKGGLYSSVHSLIINPLKKKYRTE